MKTHNFKELPDCLSPVHYFEEITQSLHTNLVFQSNLQVWELLDQIRPMLTSFLESFPPCQVVPEGFDYWERPAIGGGLEKVVTVVKGTVIEEELAIPQWGMFFSHGVILEPTAVIKAPVFIGPHTEIRQGAYLRGDTIIGSHCTVGHNTEIKTSIFLNHTEAGHFAYIGDSILGSYVNVGAGSKLANLPFRSLVQKRDMAFPHQSLKLNDDMLPLFRSKIGSILGDGVETGCNCSLSPGCFVGKDSWIYPCTSIPKGFYPANSIIKPNSRPSIIQKRPD
jgi:UDP-N-acetylglucosamine diphosphorylase / glucose-1-phosphate thymidylyltransferase / UDP-N-acetylgalactosamine diphosphorylase / glucosamine-1-phosphate N-acetyltransferase / galactosamine-1-phosphate N-acetyltransferase